MYHTYLLNKIFYRMLLHSEKGPGKTHFLKNCILKSFMGFVRFTNIVNFGTFFSYLVNLMSTTHIFSQNYTSSGAHIL